jgi:hypothetical protein
MRRHCVTSNFASQIRLVPLRHGPREKATEHFASLGFVAPARGSGEDIADWFVNLVATPQKSLMKVGLALFTTLFCKSKHQSIAVKTRNTVQLN